MTKQQPKRKPQKPPHPGDLMKTIRDLAAQQRITFSNHAFGRSSRRTISYRDAEKVLRMGEIEGEITPGENPGEWDCLVVGKRELNGRDIGAATIVASEQRLIIKTVKWKDRR
jgi:hypothetical protein